MLYTVQTAFPTTVYRWTTLWPLSAFGFQLSAIERVWVKKEQARVTNYFLRILPKTALKNPIYGRTVILRPMTSPTAIVRSSVALLPNKSDNFRTIKILLLEMVLKWYWIGTVLVVSFWIKVWYNYNAGSGRGNRQARLIHTAHLMKLRKYPLHFLYPHHLLAPLTSFDTLLPKSTRKRSDWYGEIRIWTALFLLPKSGGASNYKPCTLQLSQTFCPAQSKQTGQDRME